MEPQQVVVKVNFENSPRPYTFKVLPAHGTPNVGDYAVVKSNSGALSLVKIVTVGDETLLPKDPTIQLKYLVQIVDQTEYNKAQ